VIGFNQSNWIEPAAAGERPLNANRAILKSGLLVLLAIFAGLAAWRFLKDLSPRATGWIFAGSAIGLLAILLTTVFAKKCSLVTAPLLALAVGGLLGLTCVRYQMFLGGVVIHSVMLVAFVAVLISALYLIKVIRPDSKWRAVVIASTGSIFLVYLVIFLLSKFEIYLPFVHEAGWLGILLAGFVLFASSVCLIFDFESVERAANADRPGWAEWYAGFAILVTLVWFPIGIFVYLGRWIRLFARSAASRI
jgi:uncharacterized YccA/Bax inhibitor family protein